MELDLIKSAIGEFVGTYLFLWFSISSIDLFESNPLGIAFAFGISIAVLVYGLADISGGHLNCAVTFGLLITKEIDPVRAILYLIAQILGSTLGALTAYHGVGVSGANIVQSSLLTAMVGEFCGTFLLMYTVKQAIKLSKDLGPLMIGLSVFVAHLSLIGIDGCSINPTRSFASAVVAGEWRDQYVFWIGPLLGAAAGAGVHHLSNQ